MSISPNVGAISWLFSKAVTSKTSSVARAKFKNLYRKGYVPEIVYKFIDRAEEAAQGFFAGPAMLFEAFGFRYIGPIDGHCISDLTSALNAAKEQDVPVLVHAYTTKGKGFNAAEEDPLTWHGVQPFDRQKAVFATQKKTSPTPPSYTTVFASSLLKICQQNPKVLAITAAMPTGTGLDLIEREMPERFFDVGIAEQHAVTFAAGLACEDKVPVCAIYSTFLQRAYDQVLHDVCIQNLPVVFAMDRAGVVGNDGETHQGAFDISYLRCIPNITIMAPRDENMLQHMLFTATELGSPAALRYPRGNGEGVSCDETLRKIPIGKGELLKQGQGIAVIGIGPLLYRALEVSNELEQETGISVSVVDARFVKPFDNELLEQILATHSAVVTLEDHSLAGGFGSAVLEAARDLGAGSAGKIYDSLGMQDFFTPHASQAEQQLLHKYDKAHLRGILKNLMQKLGLSRAA
jgi:1-deoxy-D-xylulose-5-phosphate synthase